MAQIAKAHWQGNLKEGKGTLSTQSLVLNETNYSYKTRFEGDVKGTNPEELLAAAHAGCFTMQVTAMLNKKGFNPTSLDTVATVSLEKLTITGIHLSIAGSVPGISADEFAAITKEAEGNCVISKALSVEITSDASLI
ncbi:MAG TPA: OsmC family protein [Bacteroidia bacterium]|jgi:osmotically inducible protein OsmC|nr:OsmC family protein [Bacteroidia bacterium]